MPAKIVQRDERDGSRNATSSAVAAHASAHVMTETSADRIADTGTKSSLTALDKALLACGVVAPLLYLASDVIAGLRWRSYSFRDQTISELNAIGAPTRTLTIVIGIVGYTFLVAFGLGLWRTARGGRRLRTAGVALVVIGVSAWWAVPFASMHVRGAETSVSDTLHLVSGGVGGPLLLIAMWFGSAALGRRFRIYSAATVLVMLVFLVLTGMEGSRVVDNLSTPWLGVKERIWAYAYQLWLVVFAVTLLRRRVVAASTVQRGTRSVAIPEPRSYQPAAWSRFSEEEMADRRDRDGPSRRVRVVALLLIAGLVAGPVSTHVYWLLGGTWGLYTEGLSDEMASTGVRVVAAVVVVFLIAAVLVVLARVGLWRQRFVSARIIRLLAWVLAGVFLLETLASFTWGLTLGRWLYGPVSLVLGVLALVVARSGAGSTRGHTPTLPSR